MRNRYVVCIKNDGNPESLELRKLYRALPDADAAKHGYIRVVDETGEDYLYPSQYFLAIALPRRLPSNARRVLASKRSGSSGTDQATLLKRARRALV